MFTKKTLLILGILIGNFFIPLEHARVHSHQTTNKFESYEKRRHKSARVLNKKNESSPNIEETVAELDPHLLAEIQNFFDRLAIRQADSHKNGTKKDLKILVLILSSDQFPVYHVLQKLWKSYMHYDPEHVEAYFIRADPDLPQLYQINDDIILSRTSEGWTPDSSGIIKKTILSLEAMLPRLHEFDYVIRTNLSSFYIFPRLLEFLERAPRVGFYSGSNLGAESETPIASGCGFIMSPDVAALLVINKNRLINRAEMPDDMEIGLFFHKKNIKLFPYHRFDVGSLESWEVLKHNIPSSAFHFRLKQTDSLRLTHEVCIHNELITMSY